ncbi:MAG: YajQ family cyclic di-GMP-binding protein [Pseudomonadota bacterium]|nr:YajQ family cyclic di-GMP-binding protein [Pseudomonadota bacterium]
MPSFDIVSQIDQHELTNAVDQANREVSNRFDLKGSGAKVTQDANQLTVTAPNEFQIEQVLDILKNKLAARKIDIRALETGTAESNVAETRLPVTVREGVSQPLGKQIVKRIKESKLKVQAAIQGDQVRVTGKKRDDLQQVISLLKEAELDMPLQFINFRD